jgi:hypothetical protein
MRLTAPAKVKRFSDWRSIPKTNQQSPKTCQNTTDFAHKQLKTIQEYCEVLDVSVTFEQTQ